MTKTLDHTDPAVIEASAKLRVERGARWLTENFPGWKGLIDHTTLNLESPQQCICGQVFVEQAVQGPLNAKPGGFWYANEHLFGEANGWITAIVKLRVKGRGARLTPTELASRRDRVGTALGFNEGNLRFRGSDPLDRVDVSFAALQRAWEEYLSV